MGVPNLRCPRLSFLPLSPPARGVSFSVLVASQAFLEGLTRRDRAMVLPLDVRDEFILPDAVAEAEDMLERPIDMVFNCAGVSMPMGRDAAEGSSSAAGVLGVAEVRSCLARGLVLMGCEL